MEKRCLFKIFTINQYFTLFIMHVYIHVSAKMNRSVTSIRILEYPDDPSTHMRDPGLRSLTLMFDKN